MKIQFALILMLLFTPVAFAADAKAPVPAHTVKIDGVEFNIVMQAPHLMVTPLQVFGAFSYEEKNDGFSGADLEMDEGFKGAIQELRKKQHFGHLAESLLLSPPAGGIIIPGKILVMGLGNPKTFAAKDMEQVGAADIRQACQLGLSDFSHASDVQDGGVTRVNAGVIAESVITGMIHEIRLQKSLAAKNLAPACPITKIYYLAGPKFVKDTIASFDEIAHVLNTGVSAEADANISAAGK